VLGAQDLVYGHQPRKCPGDRHGDDDDAIRPDAGIDGGLGAGTDGADFIAKLGAPKQVPDGERRRDGEEHGKIQGRRGQTQVKELAGHFAEAHDVGAGDLAAFDRHLAHGAEAVVDEIGHQAEGDIVEHDGGDDNVAAALHLQDAGDPGPEGADRHGGEDGKRDHDGPGQKFEA